MSAQVPRLDDFDPKSPEFRADPYPTYRRILGMGGPVFWEYLESYIVARHADATAVLADPRFQLTPPVEVAERMAGLVPPALVPMQRTMLLSDPPEHTRLRGATRAAFAPAALNGPMQAGRDAVARALARALDTGGMDVVEDLAYPVSLRMIGDILGLPHADLDILCQWSQPLSQAMDISPGIEAVMRAAEAYERFDAYFTELAGRRRLVPENDLLSTLVAAAEQGVLTPAEVNSTATLIFISGHEVSMIFMANAFLTFGRYPEQLALLRERPELIPNAIEELIRFESPLQLATAGGGRWTTDDVEIGGRTVPAGQRVLTLIAAANRDPEVFAHPDRFDITRTPGRHLGFGHGVHYCLGGALAKKQGQILLEALVGWPKGFELVDAAPQWLPGIIQRRLDTLPIKVTENVGG